MPKIAESSAADEIETRASNSVSPEDTHITKTSGSSGHTVSAMDLLDMRDSMAVEQ